MTLAISSPDGPHAITDGQRSPSSRMATATQSRQPGPGGPVSVNARAAHSFTRGPVAGDLEGRGQVCRANNPHLISARVFPAWLACRRRRPGSDRGDRAGDRHTAAQRHRFNRMLGQLHHCLQIRQVYDPAKSFSRRRCPPLLDTYVLSEVFGKSGALPAEVTIAAEVRTCGRGYSPLPEQYIRRCLSLFPLSSEKRR
jgi:hypothetical protein